MSLTCQMSQEITKVNQFELTQKLYVKINKDGERKQNKLNIL